MADPKFPYVKWRDGKPRSSHGSYVRALGFNDADLRHPPFDERGRLVGPWFTLQEAADFSDKRKVEIDEARRIGQKRKPVTVTRKRLTVADLLEDWQRSDEFKMLAPASRDSYNKACDAILYRPLTRAESAEHRAKVKAAKLLGLPLPEREFEPLAQTPPSAIDKPELRAFYNYAKRTRGHHQALSMIAILSAAFTWGQESVDWRLKSNPRIGMDFERPDGRVVLVPIHEFNAWVAAADAIGKSSIGDSFYLGLFTGQRQTDRLMMRDESESVGRHAFRQSKTGELVDIKEAQQLTARLDASRLRIAAIKLRLGLREVPREFVINEDTGTGYDESTYRHWVSISRDVAVFGWPAHLDRNQAINRALDAATELRQREAELFAAHPIRDDMGKPERQRTIDARSVALRDWLAAGAQRVHNHGWKLAPCPAILFVNGRGQVDTKHDQDLRDTCVMLLDRAGCDLLTICDITGHSYRSAQTIVKHYRARNADRADAGIDRLVLQVRKEGLR